jgi:hypothetical protein
MERHVELYFAGYLMWKDAAEIAHAHEKMIRLKGKDFVGHRFICIGEWVAKQHIPFFSTELICLYVNARRFVMARSLSLSLSLWILVWGLLAIELYYKDVSR